jgi:hypothetical protein
MNNYITIEKDGKTYLVYPCKYDKTAPAHHACESCGAPLCSFCGYNAPSSKFQETLHYCNECWAEREEDLTGECFNCGELLEPIYENNGFNPPDPTHYEITGWKKCACGRGGGH